MLGPFGEVYLVDWGIACPASRDDAEPAPLAGTPAYMAPEMAEGERIDARTDVYLLGATLHEILTGRPLHGGATVAEAIRSALRSDPPIGTDRGARRFRAGGGAGRPSRPRRLVRQRARRTCAIALADHAPTAPRTR